MSWRQALQGRCRRHWLQLSGEVPSEHIRECCNKSPGVKITVPHEEHLQIQMHHWTRRCPGRPPTAVHLSGQEHTPRALDATADQTPDSWHPREGKGLPSPAPVHSVSLRASSPAQGRTSFTPRHGALALASAPAMQVFARPADLDLGFHKASRNEWLSDVTVK